MTPLALIRHGPTDWNEEKRLQGQADRRLSANGRERVEGWTVPQQLVEFQWFASPLTRAAETASLLGLTCEIEPALIEMDWGAWEGATMPELRDRYGDEVERRAANGLDLRPHDGESPREVRQRVARWIEGVAGRGEPTGAVCHQGVIRAVLSLATGWNMLGKPPQKMDWAAAQLFFVAADGAVEVSELNISLEPR